MPPKNNMEDHSDDFKVNQFFKSKLEEVVEDVAKLSSDIRQPDKFALIFCEAAKTQKSIDNTLKEVLNDLLKKDTEAKNTIIAIVKDVDRNYGRVLTGRIGLLIWTMITILATEFVHYIFK